MELPVNMEISLMNGLQYAYPYAILSAYPQVRNWLYQNYLLVAVLEAADKDSIMNFMGYVDAYTYNSEIKRFNYVLETTAVDTFFLQGRALQDCIEHIIDDGSYVVLFVDEYYLPSCSMYQKDHLLHEQLIYGYNREKGIYYALGNNVNANFGRLIHHYEELRHAYENGLTCDQHGNAQWVDKHRLIYMSLGKKIGEYPYLLSTFRDKVKSYMTGKLMPEESFFREFYADGIMHVGVEYYPYIQENAHDDHFPLFRHIHHMWEHKRALSKSLEFWAQKIHTPSALHIQQGFNANVVNPISQMRSKCLKAMVKNNGGHIIPESVGLIPFLKELKKDEMEILSQVVDITIPD